MEQKTYTEENLRTCTRGSERELEQKLQGGKLHGTRDSAFFGRVASGVIAAWSIMMQLESTTQHVVVSLFLLEPLSLSLSVNVNAGMSTDQAIRFPRVCSSCL